MFLWEDEKKMKRQKQTRRFLINMSMIVLVGVMIFSCDYDMNRKSMPAETDSDVMVTADPPILPSDGSSKSQVTAFVMGPSGQALDGTEVMFSTTLGSIETRATTVNGIATVTMTSSFYEGTAEIVAQSGAAEGYTLVPIGSKINDMTLSADPPNFVAEKMIDTYRSIITLTAWDEGGYPIANEPVVLKSSHGSFDSGACIYYTNNRGQVSDGLTFEVFVPPEESVDVSITAESGSTNAMCSIIVDSTVF